MYSLMLAVYISQNVQQYILGLRLDVTSLRSGLRLGYSDSRVIEYFEGHRRERPAYSLLMQLYLHRYHANFTVFTLEGEELIKQ